MQSCFRCKVIQPLENFRPDPSGRIRKNSPCWTCDFESRNRERLANSRRCRQWYLENKEEIRKNINGNPIFLEKYRKYHKENKEKIKKYNKEYRQKNKALLKKYYQLSKEKIRIRWKVKEAIRQGILTRPNKCQTCSSEGRIEAHHTDYTKPYDVMWLCVGCHKKEHYKYKENYEKRTHSN